MKKLFLLIILAFAINASAEDKMVNLKVGSNRMIAKIGEEKLMLQVVTSSTLPGASLTMKASWTDEEITAKVGGYFPINGDFCGKIISVNSSTVRVELVSRSSLSWVKIVICLLFIFAIYRLFINQIKSQAVGAISNGNLLKKIVMWAGIGVAVAIAILVIILIILPKNGLYLVERVRPGWEGIYYLFVILVWAFFSILWFTTKANDWDDVRKGREMWVINLSFIGLFILGFFLWKDFTALIEGGDGNALGWSIFWGVLWSAIKALALILTYYLIGRKIASKKREERGTGCYKQYS